MPEAEQKYFEDIEIAEQYDIPSKTITDTHLTLFAGLTGDFHPLHVDKSYAEDTPFGKRVAHGMMITMFTIIGSSGLSDHIHDSGVAFLNQSSTFRNPVFVGDTITPQLEVVEKTPKGDQGIVTLASTVHNQDGDLILEGELEVMLKCRDDD